MTMSPRVVALALVGTLSVAGIVDGVSRSHALRSQPTAGVELVGLAGQHRTVGAADLAKLPHVSATVSSHNVSGTYRGVSLGDLLRLVDRPAGENLRGKALATAISVDAADGYRVVFALAEVDSGYTNKVIFLADAKNGAPLDTAEGPFRVIVPDEKRPARWAKKVIRIRLVPVD
jgi:hypothetical protein